MSAGAATVNAGGGTGDVEITLAGERVVLTPERAAWLPGHAAVLIADTHFGKSQAMRAAGAAIPRGVTGEQLVRIDRVAARTGATRVIVLGDLIHAPVGVTDDLSEALVHWAARRGGLRVDLVPGNHDAKLSRERMAAWAASVRVDLLDEHATLGGLALRHDPLAAGPRPVVGGHHHPAVSLGGWHGKAAAYWLVGGDTLVLPAFSLFTAGMSVTPRPGERVFVVAEGRVVG